MRVKTEEKRQAIIEIAKEAFFNQGFEKTSMSYISQQLGGSKATLYNYFSSKDEIFYAVMESSATEQIANAFHSLNQAKDIRSSMLEFGINYLDSILTPEIMAIHRMVMAEAGKSELGKKFYEKGPKQGWDNVCRFLASRIASNELRVDIEPWHAAMQFKGLLEAELVMPYSLGAIGKPSAKRIREIVESAVDAFLKLNQ
ncbi:TetR/AcrR family transcriptional regulator [Shewanella avicenniae]|uniref:TetR/AcrR family transcriptional regulator n=1 Tax=Shewanella avicenniae TaxID=2814294 RepID=A0ABX7QTW1_9GAMM|nr:TetR/AcrR family transcriptional regulator [Shewanella avicenniae]QSX34350.1 TetR/AcrR family transcriptional regulator [Shewanella avicenniae]